MVTRLPLTDLLLFLQCPQSESVSNLTCTGQLFGRPDRVSVCARVWNK
jgi:hypothetical protein